MFLNLNKYNFIIFIILGFAIHSLATWFNIGFYSQDEHFQILSPVEYLLGINNDFRIDIWEFSEEYKIRPWFQSYIFYYIIIFLKFININNPFIWVFVIKLLCSFLAFISLIYFYITFKNKFFKDTKFNRFFIILFCLYPFLHSRTSSENLGMTFFVFGFIFLEYLLNNKFKNNNLIFSILTGIFFGLAIITRYQLVIFVIGCYLWVILFSLNYKNIKLLFVVGFSIIFILFVGLVFDYYGYQQINITYYRYFYTNFLDGMLDFFGKEPWWYYFIEIIKTYIPPIGFLFLISFMVMIFRKFNHIIIFVSFFYLLIFTLIGHKELRFLFPLFFFTPFIICALLDLLKNINLIKYILIFFNLIYLFFLSFIPATEQVKIYEYIYNNKIENNIYYNDDNPYLIADLNPKLYTSHLPAISKFNKDNIKDEYYLILRDYNILNDILNTSSCKKIYSVYPVFINRNPNWQKHKINWYIVYCKSII